MAFRSWRPSVCPRGSSRHPSVPSPASAGEVSPSGWPSRGMQLHHSISSSHFCARPCTRRDGNNASSFLFSPVEVAAGPSWPPAYVQAVEEVFSCTADYFTETSIVNLNSTNSISFWVSFQHIFLFGLTFRIPFLCCIWWHFGKCIILFTWPHFLSKPNT